MRIFLICPVRLAAKEDSDLAEAYVSDMERRGHDVYWPQRDTNQNDPTGVRICLATKRAIEWCQVVHVLWSEKSEGKLFDLGLAFALEKPVLLVRPIPYREGQKSYAAVVNHWPWGIWHGVV